MALASGADWASLSKNIEKLKLFTETRLPKAVVAKEGD